MRNSTDIALAPQSRAHAALTRLEQGLGTEADIADLLRTNPERLTGVVRTWTRVGAVTRFRDLVYRNAALEECKAFLHVEPTWTVALFLTMRPDVGEDLAAWLASRARLVTL